MEIPPAQLPPVVYGHHPALGRVVLCLGLVVLEPFDLQDQGDIARESHQEIGFMMDIEGINLLAVLDFRD